MVDVISIEVRKRGAIGQFVRREFEVPAGLPAGMEFAFWYELYGDEWEPGSSCRLERETVRATGLATVA